MKWKPGKYQYYYFVKIFLGKIEIKKTFWGNDNVDEGLYRMGNCFRTRKEANEKLKLIKKILKGE